MTATVHTKKAPHELQLAGAVVPTPSQEQNMDSSIARTTDTVETEHTHHEWCDTSECFLAYDEEDGAAYASHYGEVATPSIDATDCMPWRCQPSGEPEIQVRPIRFTGSRTGGVELNCGAIRNRQSTSGSVGVSWLTPAEARELADILRTAAEAAEAVTR